MNSANNDNSMPLNHNKLSNDIVLFVSKLMIFTFFLYGLFMAALPDHLNLETERNKWVAISFIKNPRVLLEMSLLHEREGHKKSALRDIKAAIGLLELYGAKQETINSYTKRLSDLKKMKNYQKT